jgi:general secretion pathway protein B
MSFILDALKKSETDRQEQSVSEFSAVPTSPQAQSVPRWFWYVGLLLAINLLVLIGLLMRPDPVTEARPSIENAGTTTTPPASGDLSEPSFAQRAATARKIRPEQQIEVVEAKESTQNFVRPVLISQDPSKVAERDLYPTLQEVRARGMTDLPDLHLDIHVFSSSPTDRFVFVNMNKLREGSTLAEGPVVAEITPDGVVLRHEGQTFLLPRE